MIEYLNLLTITSLTNLLHYYYRKIVNPKRLIVWVNVSDEK